VSVTCTNHYTVLEKCGLPRIWYHLFLLNVGPPLEGHRASEAHTQAVRIDQIMFKHFPVSTHDTPLQVISTAIWYTKLPHLVSLLYLIDSANREARVHCIDMMVKPPYLPNRVSKGFLRSKFDYCGPLVIYDACLTGKDAVMLGRPISITLQNSRFVKRCSSLIRISHIIKALKKCAPWSALDFL